MEETSPVAELQAGPHLLRLQPAEDHTCPRCHHRSGSRHRYSLTLSADGKTVLHIDYDPHGRAFEATVEYDCGEWKGSFSSKREATAVHAYRGLVAAVVSQAERAKRESQSYNTISGLLLKAGANT